MASEEEVSYDDVFPEGPTTTIYTKDDANKKVSDDNIDKLKKQIDNIDNNKMKELIENVNKLISNYTSFKKDNDSVINDIIKTADNIDNNIKSINNGIKSNTQITPLFKNQSNSNFLLGKRRGGKWQKKTRVINASKKKTKKRTRKSGKKH
jgi:hypothetical protein